MTKFKVGDKVRILKTGAIAALVAKEGAILEVVRIDTTDGTPFLLDVDGAQCCTLTNELQYIEKVSAKPTKNQRITTLEQNVVSLESEVAELKAKVEALEKAQSPTKTVTQNITVKSDADISKVASQLAKLIEGETDKRRKKMSLTPNELRKAIIAEAKAFVADITKRQCNGISEYGEGNSTFRLRNTVTEFHVNPEKRTVVALVKGATFGKLFEKAIAKCAPDDVFNADIGKAIALGRALGLDVSKFEQAVKPTKATVGQLITFEPSDEWHGVVVYRIDSVEKSGGNLTIVKDDSDTPVLGGKASANVSDSVGPQLVIYDDTEAIY